MNKPEPTVEELAAIFGYTLRHRPLDSREAADLLCLKSIEALAMMRQKGTGPRYFKPSKYVVYSEIDLLRYLHTGMATNTSQYESHQARSYAQRTAKASADTSAAKLSIGQE